jgi:hypothetical protein
MDLYKARFNSSVRLAFNEAADWYREISSSLVRSLNAEIAAAVLSIRAYPFGNRVRYDSVRRKNLNRFPYALLYVVEEEEKDGCFYRFFSCKTKYAVQGG